MNANETPTPKYRDLKVGDILQKGDEQSYKYKNEWFPATFWIDQIIRDGDDIIYRFRRPVQSSAENQQVYLSCAPPVTPTAQAELFGDQSIMAAVGPMLELPSVSNAAEPSNPIQAAEPDFIVFARLLAKELDRYGSHGLTHSDLASAIIRTITEYGKR